MVQPADSYAGACIEPVGRLSPAVRAGEPSVGWHKKFFARVLGVMSWS